MRKRLLTLLAEKGEELARKREAEQGQQEMNTKFTTDSQGNRLAVVPGSAERARLTAADTVYKIREESYARRPSDPVT